MSAPGHPWQRRARDARLERLRGASDAVDVPVTAVTYRGERFLARPVDRFRAGDVLAGNAAFVADALEAADIRYLVSTLRYSAAACSPSRRTIAQR